MQGILGCTYKALLFLAFLGRAVPYQVMMHLHNQQIKSNNTLHSENISHLVQVASTCLYSIRSLKNRMASILPTIHHFFGIDCTVLTLLGGK